MEELNATTSYLCSGPIEGLRLCISLNCISDAATVPVRSADAVVRLGFLAEAYDRYCAPTKLSRENMCKKHPCGMQVGGPSGGEHRAATEVIGWQESISCLEADAPRGAPRPLIFTHVHDDGVLQRTELQRSTTIGGRRKAGEPSAMALAVRADAAGKVDLRSRLCSTPAFCADLSLNLN